MDPIPLSQPDISEMERSYVSDVLESTRLSFGPYLKRFERQMADRCGTSHAIAVSSGTAALHCIVRSLHLQPGDEILTTPYSFVASSNALLFEDLEPVFVDIDPDTYNIDIEKAKAALTARTKGILAVDVFGVPADWPALTEFAETHDLALIDDACEALGASIGDRPIGAWGDAASFGFYPNKQMTTGEGGCITTNDADLAAICQSLRNQGRATTAEMRHVRLGFNYRLSEMQAALGCAQLDRLDDLLDRRSQAAEAYSEALAPLHHMLHRPTSAPLGQRSWFVYVVRLHDSAPPDARDRLVDALHNAGIGAAPYFPSIHLQPYYRDRFGFTSGSLPIAERVAARTLALPFFPAITSAQIERVAETISRVLPPILDPAPSQRATSS
ncbi:polysaccharide biosynthesis protein [Longibacter salinarum]|uniref:Polysaccharide biosynthesis protein n=1 Tax=Longibacter salinarum TaxID=1850348 RepID=A0A2A8D0Q4_9BACT|nr:DegT/DnrJ/EryC1/StrS family aminotransferase [Longibacter salinarum]PEN14506.1 polysaccharide biosynthesis protein [Longibacter salinarum]